jgi:hypothetical protein
MALRHNVNKLGDLFDLTEPTIYNVAEYLDACLESAHSLAKQGD